MAGPSEGASTVTNELLESLQHRILELQQAKAAEYQQYLDDLQAQETTISSLRTELEAARESAAEAMDAEAMERDSLMRDMDHLAALLQPGAVRSGAATQEDACREGFLAGDHHYFCILYITHRCLWNQAILQEQLLKMASAKMDEVNQELSHAKQQPAPSRKTTTAPCEWCDLFHHILHSLFLLWTSI